MKNYLISLRSLTVLLSLLIYAHVTFAQTSVCDSSYTDYPSYPNGTPTKTTYGYNANGNNTSQIAYNFDKTLNKWTPQTKLEYSYNSKGAVTVYIYYTWKIELNVWVANMKINYTYDSNDKLSQYLYSTWDSGNSVWLNYMKVDYTYDNTITYADSYIWNASNSSWNTPSKSKTEYTYNANSKVTSMITYTWNTVASSWSNSNKWEFSYDGNGNQSANYLYSWSTTINSWVNSSKTESAYDSNNNQTSSISYYWNSAIANWSNSSKTEFTYDSNKNKTNSIQYNWNTTSNNWDKYNKSLFFVKNSTQVIVGICPSNRIIRTNDVLTIPLLEKPTATSRIWKYKKSTETTFQTFSPSQNSNNLSYTFITDGDYNIICESTINGVKYTSDTMFVKVASLKIDPSDDQSLILNAQGTPLIVSESPTADDRDWYYSTSSGGSYSTYLGYDNTYNPTFANPGTYYIVCKSKWGTSTLTSNEVKIEVKGVSVSPSTNQAILPNTNGNILSVQENPAATAREWKYKTTPNGTWTSFSPAITQSGFTPNFAQIGNYYIACFSTIGGIVTKSNDIIIRVINGNSITPSANQTLKANVKGITLTALESPKADDRDWYYSTSSGSNYSNYISSGISYTPNFSTPGIYYVVCKSQWENTTITSNEVKIEVTGNSISPSSNQSILAGTNGNILTVVENQAATSREWKYKTTETGSWISFSPSLTQSSYTPNFNSIGTYYIACFSLINGKTEMSNVVAIRVITGSTVNPTSNQTLSVNTNGSILTVTETPVADSRYWYYSKTSGGSYTNKYVSTTTFQPNFSEPATYYVICKSIWDGITASSNEIKVDVVGNSISPTANQSFVLGSNGNTLSVLENQAATSREWKYKTSATGTWNSFSPSQNDNNFAPTFASLGSYYVACFSTINGTVYTSNEVVIKVITGNSISPTTNQSISVNTNGTTLTATETPAADSRYWYYSRTSGGPYTNKYVSAATFQPNFSEPGTYFVVCKSTWYNTTITSNEVKVDIIGNRISPSANQSIISGTNGNPLTVIENQAATSREWKYKTSATGTWNTFSPSKNDITFTPTFASLGTYYVACFSTINGTVYTSNELIIKAITGNSITPTTSQSIAANTNGTTLTVTETPTADSRYWYYSDISGGGYVNQYSSATTYQPNFAEPGTYYVVCYSKWNNTTTVSNEVLINVLGNSIYPTTAQKFPINTKCNTLSVKESSSATSRVWKYKTTSTGSWNLFSPSETQSTISPIFATAGTYYIACFSTIGGITYTSNEVTIQITSNSIAPTSIQNIAVNSNGSLLSVTESISADSRQWYCSTTSGINYFNYLGNGTTYQPNLPEPGIYYVVCKSLWNTNPAYSNEVRVNVSGNSITPRADQLIQTNTNGNTMSVSEYPTATSRVWKYKTTPSGTWNLFSPTETLTSITPKFATAGTYYIACFSTINASVYTSNEVIVRVASNSITPSTTQSISVNTNGSLLSVAESITVDSRSWYYSTTSGSNYTNYLGNNVTYQPNFSTIGTYYVICKSTWGSTSFNSNEVRIDVAGNSIAPSTDQIIAVNSIGNSISVSEYPSSTSRVWKYKTTPLGTWNLFSPTETQSTITPKLATAGTYYLSCFSTISTSTYTSNEVVVRVANNSIAPSANQTIPINTNGTLLTVTETNTVDSHNWYYSKTSGSNYVNNLGSTSNYTPNFQTMGAYFVVCKSVWGNTSVFSNEVRVDVAGNSITPTTNQTIAVNSNGNTFTVSEYPSATSRIWKYKTTPTGVWILFSPTETQTSITPRFVLAGTYYIACFSVINSNTYTSNEVTINVAGNSIAPSSNQTIAVNSNGNILTVTETFAADSHSWYYSKTSGGNYINFLGNSSTYLPNFTTLGSYFVICKSVWGSTSAISNEVKIDVAGNSITPTTDQTVGVNSNGNAITVSEYPAAISRIWKYKTTPTGAWILFSPTETQASITPKFVMAGTYYIACFSVINSSTYTSNEVTINVAGNSIAPSSNQTIAVNSNGNILTVTETFAADSHSWYYSKTSGSNYVNSLGNAYTYLPNFTTLGSYFVICKSVWGTTSAISNEVKIDVAGNGITPTTDQTVPVNSNGNAIIVSEYPAATSRIWKYKTSSSGSWNLFSPSETQLTITPKFSIAGTYSIACFSTIGANTYASNEVNILVQSPNKVNDIISNSYRIYPNPSNGEFYIQLKNISIRYIQILDMNGITVFKQENNVNDTDIPVFIKTPGVYIIKLVTIENSITFEKMLIIK